jgi:uncharacterized membrane protein
VTFSKIFGLPAHPLFVHIPIVLIPLAAIGAVAMAFSGHVRDRYGWLVLALGIVAVGTNVRLFQIGDSGAKATWQRVHIRKDASRDRTGEN